MLDEIRGQVNFQAYAEAKVFQWGFKIRDKENPKDWYKVDKLILVPPKEKLEKGAIEKAKDFATRLTNQVQGKP